jgi:hypothetical protein
MSTGPTAANPLLNRRGEPYPGLSVPAAALYGVLGPVRLAMLGGACFAAGGLVSIVGGGAAGLTDTHPTAAVWAFLLAPLVAAFVVFLLTDASAAKLALGAGYGLGAVIGASAALAGALPGHPKTLVVGGAVLTCAALACAVVVIVGLLRYLERMAGHNPVAGTGLWAAELLVVLVLGAGAAVKLGTLWTPLAVVAAGPALWYVVTQGRALITHGRRVIPGLASAPADRFGSSPFAGPGEPTAPSVNAEDFLVDLTKAARHG